MGGGHQRAEVVNTFTGTCRAGELVVGLVETITGEREGGVMVLMIGSCNLACGAPSPSLTTKKTTRVRISPLLELEDA